MPTFIGSWSQSHEWAHTLWILFLYSFLFHQLVARTTYKNKRTRPPRWWGNRKENWERECKFLSFTGHQPRSGGRRPGLYGPSPVKWLRNLRLRSLIANARVAVNIVHAVADSSILISHFFFFFYYSNPGINLNRCRSIQDLDEKKK